MRNRTYGGVRGRKTKVGRKLLRFPPTRLFGIWSDSRYCLVIVPTERTECTEAYGVIFFESTERIDATRHTTDGTEMKTCVG
mgnify:CR=1 FL=1